VAAHLLVFAALVWKAPVVLKKTEHPGSRNGKLLTMTYLPGASEASQTDRDSAHPETIVKSPRKQIAPPVDAKLTLPTPSQRPADTAAATDDSMGSGDITLALVDNHPRPQPSLPPNTHGDVILDVTIGADGKISQTTLVRGLGKPMDDIVIATVQTWTFHPATKNGTPVASEQELLFHYDRA